MSPRKRTQTVVGGGRILGTLGEAAKWAASLRGSPVTADQRPAIRRLYLEAETAVFLLKLAAGEEEAPPYDASLEKLERSGLVSRTFESLEKAMALTAEDESAALKEARIARDCAATLLHSVNLESRRTRR